MERKQSPRTKKKSTIVDLVETIVKGIEDSRLESEKMKSVLPQLLDLSQRYSLSLYQAIFFSIFISMFDDHHINVHDLSRFLDCSKLTILHYWKDIEALCSKRLIRSKVDNDGDISFYIPADVMASIRNNTIYTAPSRKNLTSQEWIDVLTQCMHEKDFGNISWQFLQEEIDQLISLNPSLPIVRAIKAYSLKQEDCILLLAMTYLFLANNDSHIGFRDLEDMMESKSKMQLFARELSSGTHILMKRGLVEHSTEDGQVESNYWCLTQKAKKELLEDITYVKKDTNAGLMMPEKIVTKELFYNPSVTEQVQRLTNLLQKEEFRHVQNRLVEKGMRKGFACIFYGSPGTGKTETVLQLARQTGRPIKMVDVPNLRSKWVGETEKNIKAVFDDYRQMCNDNDIEPILLFNEADAILNKRNEGAVRSVDKMENALQNIILQEMETLDGIMIATTNLTNNLDSAFERRFLYKIEFP
ncbi:MAG: ATP-binding protein, partial [Bacilli bacterium]|nr:ATP-binding protein [Bacilli bacterium]